jgi:hypothetical protein
VVLAALAPSLLSAQSTGPFAFWKLDEGSGTTAADSAGSATGQLRNGAAWTTGRLGNAVSFDGTDDFIALPNLDVSGSTLTLSAWVKNTAFPNNIDQRFISKSTDAAEQSHYWLLSHSNAQGQNRLRFRLRTGTHTTTLIASSGELPLNQWYHAAATYDGANMRLYLNGALVGTASKTGTIATNANVPVNIARSPDGTNYLRGTIDDVRIYRRALSASEIAALASAATSDTSPPSQPSALKATTVSSTRIDLTWTASTDNVGVTGYRVLRNGSPLTTVTTPSYSDTGLTPSTTYQYAVDAFDAAGNRSSASATVSAATLAGADTTPPVISDVTASSVTASGATITWTTNEAATSRVDFGATTSYGSSAAPSGQRTNHSVALSGLSASTLYHYKVTSVDAAGNQRQSGDFTFTTAAAPSPPPSGGGGGEIARWTMNEAGGATARDSIGGRVATLQNGASWTAGRSGGAINFDGVDDYASLAPFDVSGSALTIAAWVKTASLPANVDQRFVSKATNTSEQGHYWMLSLSRNRLRFRLRTEGQTSTLVANAGDVPVNQWYHVAATYDGGAMRLFLNGTEVGVAAKSGVIDTGSTVPVNLGRNPDGSNYMHGALDDLRIFSRALSAQEIAGIAAEQGSGTPAPSNAAPTVSLTAPSDGASFAAGAAITVSASAQDADGTIARVEFRAGSTVIGSDTTSPYSVSWANAPAGTHSLTAIATDNAGATTTSSARTITVAAAAGNQYPVVSLTAPQSGATYAEPATVNITANASDPDGSVTRVDFFAGSTPIGGDTSSPYSATWSNAPPGTHSIVAIARDNLGLTTTSAPRVITVSRQITSGRAVFNASSNHGTAVDRYELRIFRIGEDTSSATPVRTQDLGKPPVVNGEISADITATIVALAPGEYIAVVRAIGAGGTTPSADSPSFTR